MSRRSRVAVFRRRVCAHDSAGRATKNRSESHFVDTDHMHTDLTSLMPSSKRDTAKAEQLIALGYPKVEPVLPQILEWVQDLNWPVAIVFQRFLITIGAPLAPYVRAVLLTSDDPWKYSLMIGIVWASPGLAQALRQDVERIARTPTAGELAEEVSEAAAQVLKSLDEDPST